MKKFALIALAAMTLLSACNTISAWAKTLVPPVMLSAVLLSL